MKTLRILMIEDVEADFLLIARHLRTHGVLAAPYWVQGEPELTAALDAGGWDLVLSDYKVPGLAFDQVLERIKARLPHVPVILVSGSIGEETAVDLFRKGLTDFVLKDRLVRLVPAIERGLREETEKKKRREAENRFKSLIDHANSAIWIKDPDGKILVMNEFLLHLLQKRADEVLGRTVFELLPPAMAADFAEQERQVLLSGLAQEREETLQLPDGGHTFLSVKFPLRDENGTIHSLGAICADITKLKQTERQLQTREEEFRRLSQEYRTLLDNVPDGIVHLSRDLRILWINAAAQRMFDLEAGTQPAGELCYTAFWRKDERCAACPVIRSLTTLNSETGSFLPGSSGREFELRAIPMINEENGELEGVLEIIRDMTAHRKLEEQFRQAQKMESIGTLAGGIAHDFNNILSAILGYAEIALEDLEETHPAYKSVRTVHEAGLRASHLTRDLLMFSRKQVCKKEPVDINHLIARIEKFIRRIIGEDIQFETHLAKEPLPVNADSHQIDQILMNFATNARDAMPGGGYLSIATERIYCDEDFIATHGFGKPGSYVRIAVADTGKGMDRRTATKVFDPFFTTKEMGKGTGLGLAVVYGIVMEHQGYIQVVSEPGEGTVFTVYLPLLEEEAKEKPDARKQAPPRGGTETILLAEDDATVRELFARVLAEAGYRVIMAINGEEAVRVFTEDRETIDLVVFDLIMPRMNGKEALEAIRQQRPAIRGIFVSGYAPENIQQKDLVEAHMEVLYKPVSPKALLRAVRRVLDAP